MVTLDKDALRSFLMSETIWELDSEKNALVRTFLFKKYKDGITFANKVAEIAEEKNHHPEITINWGSVTVSSTTHDDGNTVTNKDLELVRAIDAL